MRSRYVWSVLLALFSGFVFAHPAQAQNGTLTGVVVGEGGMVLTPAEVVIRGPVQRSVITNDRGRFMTNVPAGTYSISVGRITTRNRAWSSARVRPPPSSSS